MTILFPTMVHFVKPIVDYARGIKTMPEEFFEKHPFYRLLFQDEELATLANRLLELIPVTDDNIKYDSKSIQTAPVTYVVDQVEHILRNMVPSFHFSTSLSQTEMEQLQLWNFVCTIQDQYASKPWHYGYYDLAIDDLFRVTFIPKIQLIHCDLTSDHQKVYLNAEWSGPFKSIESIAIPGTTQSFWYATCDNDDTSLSLNVMRYFLYLQVSAGWGENKWLPDQVQPNGNLTATLQLLQAEISGQPSELPLSEAVLSNVSDFIVQQFYPKHIEVSERLEVKLREELERRQNYCAQGLLENKFLDQINQWINELIAYREAYHNKIST